MSYQGISNIMGQAEKEFAPQQAKTGQSSEMGRQAFLKLLITQLEHQDPTSPMKDEDFVAQLAQFSSLEQLTGISEGIDQLNKSNATEQIVNAAGFLGKNILAKGDEISKKAQDVSTLYYNLEDEAQQVYFNIFDQNGNILRTLEAGAKQPGAYELHWDGMNYLGEQAADGTYTVSAYAEGKNGETIAVNTEIRGQVTAIREEEGRVMLTLSNGREVQLAEVNNLSI